MCLVDLYVFVGPGSPPGNRANPPKDLCFLILFSYRCLKVFLKVLASILDDFLDPPHPSGVARVK